MFQEFLDEVTDTSLQPDRNPRFTIEDNNGKVINDDVQIYMKTPLVQNSTPLNRANIRNLQGDLYTQDRYNTPSYSGTAMTLNLPLTSYEVGKVIKIKAPAALSNPTLNVNGLGAKAVAGDLISGRYYNLVFDGTNFLIQRTKTNVSKAPIVITSSGNYTIDTEIVYKMILVGGGGGAGGVLNTYSDMAGDVQGGGAGGVIIDTFIPKTSTISVTIGAGGSNLLESSSTSLAANGQNGGNTIIDNFIAYGGDGGSAYWSRYEETRGTKGTGGTYKGGLGLNGYNAFDRSYDGNGNTYGTGGDGFVVEGIQYGMGGSVVARTNDAQFVSQDLAKQGVAVLYPIL